MGHKFTRQKLYYLVWSEPTKKLAGRLGISDVGLAKACRKAGIPLPSCGYWAKKEAGLHVHKTDLSLRFPGASDTVKIGKDDYSENWQQKLIDDPIPPPPAFEEDISDVKKRIEAMVSKIRFQKTTAQHHPIIGKLLAQDEERRKNGYDWRTPVYEEPIQKRWLNILNALFLAASRLGCSITMSASQYAGTDRLATFRVGDENISIKLSVVSESYQFHERDRPRKRHLRLCLMKSPWQSEHIRHAWEDTKGGPLEKRLAEILTEIVLTAEIDMRESAIRHHEWLGRRKVELIEECRREKIEAERKARELREKQEKERIDRLLAEAAALQKADAIRSYVATIRTRSGQMPVPPGEIERWAGWALEQADWIDPCKSLGFLKTAETEK